VVLLMPWWLIFIKNVSKIWTKEHFNIANHNGKQQNALTGAVLAMPKILAVTVLINVLKSIGNKHVNTYTSLSNMISLGHNLIRSIKESIGRSSNWWVSGYGPAHIQIGSNNDFYWSRNVSKKQQILKAVALGLENVCSR
jgi:hemoglobin-like flavoprotein